MLPGDVKWYIVFDSDGFGAVESEAGEVLILDELFRLVLCSGESGELIVIDRAKLGIWSLAAKRSMNRSMSRLTLARRRLSFR